MATVLAAAGLWLTLAIPTAAALAATFHCLDASETPTNPQTESNRLDGRSEAQIGRPDDSHS